MGIAAQMIDTLDMVVAKAVGVSTVARIARIEVNLRKYVTREWETIARDAAKVATPMLLGSSTVNQVMRKIDPIYESWKTVIKKRYMADIEKAYKLARKAGWDQATGQKKGSLQYNTPPVKTIETEKADPPQILDPVFDAVDTAAVKSLQQKEIFWIGEMYDTGVRGSIVAAATEVIESGRGRAFASTQLTAHMFSAGQIIKMPGGYSGNIRGYLEGTVANGVTVARAQGQLKSFDDFEIKQYRITNPLDERSCIICGPMDGKIFTVDQGKKIAAAEIEAKTPDEVREVHTWMNPEVLEDGSVKLTPRTGGASITTKPGNQSKEDSAALANAGFALPSFHFRCRCAIDAIV